MIKSRPAKVIVRCSGCGDVRVAPAEVGIRHCVDDGSWSYWFLCPSCHLRAAATTHQEVALEAVRRGAMLVTWRLPAELHERPGGPPLTPADLLDLHMQLQVLESD